MQKNMISGPKNVCHYPRSRSFAVKFADKVPLTLSNVPAKFAGKTEIDLEKSAKNMISGPKIGRHYPRSRSFEVKFTDKVSLSPSNVRAKFLWNN